MIRAGESARYLLCGAFVGIAFFQLTQSGVDVTISHSLPRLMGLAQIVQCQLLMEP